MRLPKVDPRTGSLLNPIPNALRSRDVWKEGHWVSMEWWDDDSPPFLRMVGAWCAPMLADPIGFSVPRGVFYYEDVEGDIRRVHWYNKRSGFEWLLAPCKARPETVLRHSMSWTDWQCMRGMQWKNTREVLSIIYHKVKAS